MKKRKVRKKLQIGRNAKSSNYILPKKSSDFVKHFSLRAKHSRERKSERKISKEQATIQRYKNSRYESRFSRKGFTNRRCSIQSETRLKEKKKRRKIPSFSPRKHDCEGIRCKCSRDIASP